mmetsp:Transcript_37419/g.87877  ORF Transcript_37419/g.87877 Transcript_37419/m.87877 type:complete len:454 (+) Transcript_37419:1-1362(+)
MGMRNRSRGAMLVATACALIGAAHGMQLSHVRSAGAVRLAPAAVRRRCVRALPRGAFSATALAADTTIDAASVGAAAADQEAIFMEKTKLEEEAEKQRLADLKASNMTGFVEELRKYVDQINATGPPPLAPDNELRDVVLRSSTPPSRLHDDIYNYTFVNVPYEDAMYICAPEQATLLHLLARTVRAREALDIGSFTGYAAAAVMQALPASGRLTAIEMRGEYSEIAERFLGTLPPRLESRVGDALVELAALEAEGRQFDFITIDADKQQQQQYYEFGLRLLRPRGLLVMFGMMLYPTEEDKEAIDDLISLVANDTRVTTTMLPVGCGVQICTKNGARLLDGPLPPPADLPPAELRQYLLEAELSAIELALSDAERNRATGGRYEPHVPPPSTRAASAAAAPSAGGAAALDVAAADSTLSATEPPAAEPPSAAAAATSSVGSLYAPPPDASQS